MPTSMYGAVLGATEPAALGTGSTVGGVTIAGVADLTGWVNVKAHGVTGDGSTDDTAAIQTLITAAGAAGGGTLFFQAGTYKLSSAPTTVNGSTAQLHFPSIGVGVQGNPVIRLLGAWPNMLIAASVDSTILPSTSGAIFSSTATSGAVFGGATAGPGFTLLTPWMENLTVRVPSNPQCHGIDLLWVEQCLLRAVQVDTGIMQCDNIVAPTHGTYGIRLPGINCGAFTRLENCFVIGFDTGILLGEHADLDAIQVWGCKNALEVSNQNHAMRIGRLLDVHCTNGINVTASSTPHPRLIVHEYATEYVTSGNQGTAPDWQRRATDIKGNDVLYGLANVAAVEGNVGPTSQWLTSGITHFVATSLGA